LIISPLNRRAREIASLVLPVAVGPTMVSNEGVWLLLSLNPSPQLSV
jgi:hypothetical protein